MSETLEEKAQRAQRRVLDSIPPAWRISSDIKAKYIGSDARRITAECGILTARQLTIVNWTATEILQHLIQQNCTASEVTEAFCASAAIAHQVVNCLVEFFPREAMLRAAELDRQFTTTGKLVGVLHGIPLAVKDTHDMIGKSPSFGFAAWLDNPPAETDSAGVQTLRDAGAVFFARTTMPQTGMALETNSVIFGRTLNSFNANVFGSGGSSGGDGALVGMKGAPTSGVSTDIGGSIRAPAAFNGLYGIRPTFERSMRTGLASPSKGNISIKVSMGPVSHSIADVKLITKLLLTHPTLPFESTCCLPFWNEATGTRHGTKLRIGVMTTDNVVEPHPPIRRALRHVQARLRAAGHTIVEFSPPFSCWEAALTTWALYFQTGAVETYAALKKGGEDAIPPFAHHQNIFNHKALTVPELWAHNRAQTAYKAKFQKAWDAVEGGSLDCIICPSAPMAGVPHDFPVWWGYLSLFNLLDYPSTIVPLKGFQISAKEDPKDLNYSPRSNPYDRANWEIYDPEVWKTQPVTFQIVGRPYRDEDLIEVTEIVDTIVNGNPAAHS